MASTARLTRLCSLVSGLAQDSRANVERKTSERFMGPPPESDAERTAAVCHYSARGRGLKIALQALMSRKRNLMRTDRLGYLAGGIALIVLALRRPSLPRAAGAGGGGRLLYS